MISQNKMILGWMSDGNSITAIEALEKFRCFRLAARINDLKNKKIKIKKDMIKINNNIKRVAKYYIEQAKNG